MRREEVARHLEALLGELTRFARWLVPSDHDADETVQNALIRALDGAAELRDPSAVRAWLFRIARNAHVDLQRGHAARDRFVVLEGGLEDLVAVEGPPADLPTVEPIDLERALAQLPEGARTALLLTDLWGFDHEEVSKILDIPLGTVKSRVARARARVAAILSDRQSRSRRGA